MKTKLFAAIILVSMIGTMLVACQGEKNTEISDLNGMQGTSETTEEIVIDESNVLTLFEKENFEGRTFNVLCASVFNSAIIVPQSPDSDIVGEPVNDALFAREYMIEDFYNVAIEYTVADSDDHVRQIMEKNITAGEDTFHLALGSMAVTAYPIALKGLLIDLNSLPEINLENQWWNKHTIKDLCIDNKVYFATGDITNRSVTAISGYAFNMTLFKDYNIEYPYKSINDGTWTFEKMAEIYKGKAQDLNGDGEFRCDDDFIPLHTGGYINYFCAGGRIVDKNTEGKLELVYDTQSNVDLLDNLLTVISGNDVLYNTGYSGADAFKENRVMFLYLAGCDLSLLRDMNDDFGFVLFPKYRENDDYITPGNYWIATCAMIPKTVKSEDMHFAAKMTETMAAVSRYTSIKAKYDILLMEKELRDEDSKKMVILATNTMAFDMGKLGNIGNIAGIIEEAFTERNEYMSKYAAASEKATAELNELVEAIGN